MCIAIQTKNAVTFMSTFTNERKSIAVQRGNAVTFTNEIKFINAVTFNNESKSISTISN